MYANSSRDAKTKKRQVDIQTSMALMYDTRGSEDLEPVLCVVMVSTVKTPREILKLDKFYPKRDSEIGQVLSLREIMT